MLIPKNLSPDDCVYYNAAFVLQALLQKGAMTIADLFCEVRMKHNMSYSLFVLCLDWLYLIDSIKLNEEERIALCS